MYKLVNQFWLLNFKKLLSISESTMPFTIIPFAARLAHQVEQKIGHDDNAVTQQDVAP